MILQFLDSDCDAAIAGACGGSPEGGRAHKKASGRLLVKFLVCRDTQLPFFQVISSAHGIGEANIGMDCVKERLRIKHTILYKVLLYQHMAEVRAAIINDCPGDSVADIQREHTPNVVDTQGV